MSKLLRCPRRPERPVRLVLISGEYPVLGQRLRELKIEVIETSFDSRLPKPTAFHPDMQACPLDLETLFVLRESSLLKKLAFYDMIATETAGFPQSRYPGDVLCNAFAWNGFLVGNMGAIDKKLRKKALQAGLRELPVRQGYASCSAALVTETAAMVSDPGMAEALEKKGFEILRIRPGFIELPGYDYGFIGGCCGKLAPELLAFSGSLQNHPDRERILKFLSRHGVETIELTNEVLTDVGGIMPLL